MNLLLFLWQLPQNILGLLYIFISKGEYQYCSGDVHIFTTASKYGSVSLGNFVFVSVRSSNLQYTLAHEMGHAIQSKYLGPLYLIVIGIPSFLWALSRRYSRKLRNKDYYSFYTEKWANQLSGL